MVKVLFINKFGKHEMQEAIRVVQLNATTIQVDGLYASMGREVRADSVNYEVDNAEKCVTTAFETGLLNLLSAKQID